MDRRWRATFTFSMDDQPTSRNAVERAIARILDRYEHPSTGHVQIHIDVYSVVGEVPYEFAQQEAQCYERLGISEQSRLGDPSATVVPGHRVRPSERYL